jgi:hypothetical protein
METMKKWISRDVNRSRYTHASCTDQRSGMQSVVATGVYDLMLQINQSMVLACALKIHALATSYWLRQ